MRKMKVSSPFGESPVFFKPETESTMTDVKNLASQGLPSGTVVMAGHQLAGRGRFPDRKWHSVPGESLAFSLLFQVKDFPPITGVIPLKAGLAVAMALEKEFGLEPEIKWPNDVFLKGRKAAGILVESREEHIFIGVGVNCGPKSYPKDLKKTAISLQEVTSRRFTPEDLLFPVLKQLKIWLSQSAESETAPPGWQEEIEKRLYAKGRTVTFLPGLSDGTGAFEAVILGIQDDGMLLLKNESWTAPRAFANGELRYTPPKKSFFAKKEKQ
ncbi:MAG: biotin--[acetyl-CoA-carboxylase] ligase [Spirochaetales bacterium]|jgi:BirA family biotin operon repressor/biotin-[acetyl-CoA-carboxylase] ligase|nr:biotin--[acetyl-CoA-carboxylase] ligase [Spirochaetales bacterium]